MSQRICFLRIILICACCAIACSRRYSVNHHQRPELRPKVLHAEGGFWRVNAVHAGGGSLVNCRDARRGLFS
eukprot:1158024-Pelagomonas_calceolata.AAC.1